MVKIVAPLSFSLFSRRIRNSKFQEGPRPHGAHQEKLLVEKYVLYIVREAEPLEPEHTNHDMPRRHNTPPPCVSLTHMVREAIRWRYADNLKVHLVKYAPKKAETRLRFEIYLD